MKRFESIRNFFNRKTSGVVFGVLGLVLWFKPFIIFQFNPNDPFYKTGLEMGGMSYLLIVGSVAFAIFSWIEEMRLLTISAMLNLYVCLSYVLKVYDVPNIYIGSGLGWFTALSVIGLFYALVGLKSAMKKKEADLNRITSI